MRYSKRSARNSPMNRIFLLLTVAVVFAAACNDAAGPPVRVANTPPVNAAPERDEHGHATDTAPRISLADAKKDFDAGTAVFIDTHSPEQYAQRHITGSINIPANNLNAYFDKIPKGKKIIAYCS
jgi:hypothetical protein